MAIKKTLGGDRVGSGNKMKVNLHAYERSTHDLSFIFRSTMAPGTLVPYMVQVGLPGDTFDINLNSDVKTNPTIGPLFGSFKLQLDVYTCPIRLYIGALHNNKLGIGMNMAQVKMPILEIPLKQENTPLSQENLASTSSLISYLGWKGAVGSGPNEYPKAYINAVPTLAYWDIYKNYYANKQEEIGVVIHNEIFKIDAETVQVTTEEETKSWNIGQEIGIAQANIVEIEIPKKDSTDWTESEFERLYMIRNLLGNEIKEYLKDIGGKIDNTDKNKVIWEWNLQPSLYLIEVIGQEEVSKTIELEKFPLQNIDDMREDILAKTKQTTPYLINSNTQAPYGLMFETKYASEVEASYMYNQEGLGIKTYQSDIFNNWLSTEWIDGDNGISAITAIDTSSGDFTIDTLNLSKKVYDMLNRIAVSGGSYNDWMEAVWTHDAIRAAESPIYNGGMSEEIVFQEVVSNSATEEQPLGTLAGRGNNVRRRGGYIRVKIDEPSFIIGIVSITPRIDYSQGNEWYNDIQTMDDFHKPALDQIGFQDLITSKIAWWEEEWDMNEKTNVRSAGKQPAWIDYMTNYNKTFGGFAETNNQMFMTLNRRYEMSENEEIKDLTTYIDPTKFNYAFAQTDLRAQNFWVQLGVDIEARRKMSAKIMPNL